MSNSQRINIFDSPSDSKAKDFSKVEIPFEPKSDKKKEYNSLESLYRELRSCSASDSLEFETRMEEILIYVVMAENSKNLTDESGRAKLLANLSYGFRKSGEALAWAITRRRQAEKKLKMTEAVAAIDEFAKWAKEKKETEKDFKPTADTRKYYSQISPSVLEANGVLAALEGMVEYLFSIKAELKESLSTLRSIMYGNRDSNSVGWGSGSSSGSDL